MRYKASFHSFIIGSFFSCLCGVALAQHTMNFQNTDYYFYQGKELFVQKKYPAASRSFENYLSKADLTSVGQKQEAEYYIAAIAYRLRQDNTMQLLKEYLSEHPYTPFASQVNAMLGGLMVEKKNYASALTYLNAVDDTNLDETDAEDFLFCKGFALIKTSKFKESIQPLGKIMGMNSKYNHTAIYYYAYAQYALKNYNDALAHFLKIEEDSNYKKLIPYYLTQIYYAQNKYDKVYEQADKVLKDDPDNKNNAEVYRILGEMAYKKNNYSEAIQNLKKYQELFPQVLRNDMYILGVSCYKTEDYTNTIQYLSKVTTVKDEMTENAYLYLGYAYVKLNDVMNARMSFEASLRTKFKPEVREEALFNYALTTLNTTSAFGESIAAFDQFLKEFPNSKHTDQAYDYLTNVYTSTKKYEAAYASIQKIKQPNSQLIALKQYVLYQIATEAFMQKEYKKAIEYYGLSMNSSKTGKYIADCLYWRSESYLFVNQPDKSINDLNAFFLNQSVKSNQNYVIANYSMGYAFFSKKDYTNALNWFLKYTNNEVDKSIQTYADALDRLGDCYFYERNFSKAQNYYTQAAKANPSGAAYSLFQSAYVAGLQKNYNQKITELQNLLIKFPQSEYNDDALYEIGRAYLMMENNTKAIETYEQLLHQYPGSSMARKAMLETGMICFNSKDYGKAIESFKKVITTYPETDEARTALESLETVYIETDNVNEYLKYTKTLGRSVSNVAQGRADSISFIAAEKQYMNEKIDQAITSLKSYLNDYCPKGKYCITATYYLAECYYRTNDKESALSQYENVLKLNGINQYVEQSVIRCAEITYDQKKYESALRYFKQLQSIAQTAENKNVGKLGVLRCSYFLNDNQTTVSVVNDILSDPASDNALKLEARYNRAKAYLALNQLILAEEDLKILAEDTRTSQGAESKYLLANDSFNQNKLKEAENIILDFAKKNTPYPFWLARSFVLLADIYIKENNDFQAKQYLLSLQKNYTTADEIQTLINERLNAISEREKTKIIN